MTKPDDEYIAEFERSGEPVVRANLNAGRYSGIKARLAPVWLDKLDREKEAASRTLEDEFNRQQTSLAREANEIARASNDLAEDANALARKASTSARIANAIAIASAAIAAISAYLAWIK